MRPWCRKQGSFNNMSSVASLLKMFRILTKKSFHKLRKKVDRAKEWPMGAATVNAAYDPTQNAMSKLLVSLNTKSSDDLHNSLNSHSCCYTARSLLQRIPTHVPELWSDGDRHRT